MTVFIRTRRALPFVRLLRREPPAWSRSRASLPLAPETFASLARLSSTHGRALSTRQRLCPSILPAAQCSGESPSPPGAQRAKLFLRRAPRQSSSRRRAFRLILRQEHFCRGARGAGARALARPLGHREQSLIGQVDEGGKVFACIRKDCNTHARSDERVW